MDAGLSPKLGHLINYLSHLSFSIFFIFTVECDINRNADLLFPEALSNPSGVSVHFVTYISVFFPKFDFDHKFDSSDQPQNIIAKKVTFYLLGSQRG